MDATSTALLDLLSGSQRIEREIRLLRAYTPPGDVAEEHSAWIFVSSFPLFDDDGKVRLVLSYILDISHQKWTEGVQARVAAAALLAKRQQEVINGPPSLIFSNNH